ncbi:hypothetical protein TTHERM_01027550 (macronuclear) [Tetrahymena thermophila SB210]|uniref:Uncharacterized protein n=1 Tax=Tetrahymena thermophila (strain SB210) TaxID=312017 RepID=Q22CM3_TETTS|nr:hypothetical protein TTHERM_01027550 [Tetrahymena thermophila SB210]EAR83029.1 hypothetical protein TTHERM_01027550 [Tetrahymena thermophila SB210]|eukprot:XP_001030692.1 hypothetical protein TTHERM_01027550 [Tetrahymena thermophila SB210]
MSSQYNNNKILSQPLLSIISTLNEDDLLRVFNSFISYSEFSIEKNCKITSYKCYESVYVCNGKKATGFGRNEKEANVNCIRNLIQLLLSDDKVTKIFRDCLKKMNEDQQFEKISQHPAELGVQDQQKLLNIAQHSNQNQQQINLATQSSKGGSSSGTPYQNNPNSFQISQLDFRTSYENFYSDVKNNPQHQTSIGNNNSSATPSNQLNNQSMNNNQTSFQKYYNDSLVTNSLNQPPNQFVSITKSMSQPHPEDYSNQSQQQNLFTSQGDDYIHHLRTNTLSSTNSALNQNLAQQQLNTSINLQTTSQTNFYNNLQHSAPKEKPVIQPFSNVSTDGIPNNLISSISASSKNTVQNKQSYEDAQKIAPLPQHKHSRNKSMNISGNYQASSINLNNNPEFNALSSNFSTKSIDKDPKYVAMEEELKRSKNYIEHLERKIKLVVEENKILKSLLLENKKSSNSNNSKITNVNTNVMNTTNTSMSNLNNTYNQQSTVKQIAQTLPTNENIPPLSIQNQMQSTKQSYFLPQNMNISSATPQYQGQNNSLLNISTTNYYTQQHNISTSNKDQSLYLENSNKKNISTQIFEQPTNQNNVLKDFNNKANIIANVQTIPETQKIKPNPNFAPSMLADENVPKITNEKIRSLSVDINAKRSTLATDNSFNKLDTSLIESGSQANKMMGHKKYKSKIPKLNLEVLPNYHGLNNKSINQQLLQQYQASQQKAVQKTSEKK